MRVSTDPNDPAYIDARPRKAWVNDKLIEGWVVADEFRRCVITADGKVHNGAVLIERLPAEAQESGEALPSIDAGLLPPIDTGFVGVFEHVPAPKPAPVAAEPMPAPDEAEAEPEAPAEAEPEQGEP